MDQLGYGNLLAWRNVQKQRKGEEPRCARAAWRSAQPIPWLSRRKSRLVSSLG